MLSIGVFSVWAAAMVGATRLHTLDLDLGHGVCGPWGCAATPEALLGYHVLLTLVLSPIVAGVCRFAPPPAGAKIALACLAIGMAGLLAIFGVAAVDWLREEGPRYAFQRGLFVVATTPDVPTAPLAIAGLLGLGAAKNRRPVQPPVDAELATAEN